MPSRSVGPWPLPLVGSRSCLCLSGPFCIWHSLSCSQASHRLARVFAHCGPLHCPVVLQAWHACRHSVNSGRAIGVGLSGYLEWSASCSSHQYLPGACGASDLLALTEDCIRKILLSRRLFTWSRNNPYGCACQLCCVVHAACARVYGGDVLC